MSFQGLQPQDHLIGCVYKQKEHFLFSPVKPDTTIAGSKKRNRSLILGLLQIFLKATIVTILKSPLVKSQAPLVKSQARLVSWALMHWWI